MKNDEIQRRGESILAVPVKPASPRFTEEQVTRMIDAGAQVAGDVADIARDVVAIARIREQAGADVARAAAETASIVAHARGVVDRLQAEGNNIRSRGEVTMGILRTVTAMIQAVPDADDGTRRALVDSLRFLVESTLRNPPAGPASP